MMYFVLIFPIFGFLMIFIPASNYVKLKNKIAHGEYMVTDGQVIDFQDVRDEDGVTYAPIYEFYANGKPYRCVSKVSSSWRSHKSRKIAYDPNNPIDSKVVNGNLSIIVFGIIFFLIGLIITISTIRG